MEIKFYVEGAGFRFGECFALFYTIKELKRHIRAQYPGKYARIWVERGYGMGTTVTERWERPEWSKNFRKVRYWGECYE